MPPHTDTPRSATEMTDSEYRVARTVAAAGKLQLAMPAPATPLPPAIDALPPEPPPASNSSSTAVPPEPAPPGGRGVLTLTDSAYRQARADMLRQADGGRTGRTTFAAFGR